MQYKNGLTKDFNWGGEIGTRVGARGMKFGTREEYTSVNLGPSFPNTISVFQFGPNLGLKTEVLYKAEQFPHFIILVTCDNYLHELLTDHCDCKFYHKEHNYTLYFHEYFEHGYPISS